MRKRCSKSLVLGVEGKTRVYEGSSRSGFHSVFHFGNIYLNLMVFHSVSKSVIKNRLIRFSLRNILRHFLLLGWRARSLFAWLILNFFLFNFRSLFTFFLSSLLISQFYQSSTFNLMRSKSTLSRVGLLTEITNKLDLVSLSILLMDDLMVLDMITGCKFFWAVLAFKVSFVQLI